MYNTALFEKESLYIAGPECFYPNGYALWNAMRKKAEYYGFRVTMPNDNKLDLDHEDLRLNADTIFAGCKRAMAETTVLIADLSLFRSTEADGGTLFEMGMAYAKGCPVYGFTRDKRSMACRNPYARLQHGRIYAQDGQLMPYADLPFSPAVCAVAKIIEGDFDACLQAVMTDLIEAEKARARGALPTPASTDVPHPGKRPVLYLSGPERYAEDAYAQYRQNAVLCEAFGFETLTPAEALAGDGADPYFRAVRTFAQWETQIRACDAVIADLNDFHGLEPLNDTAIECGMAYQLGKRLIGYMGDTRRMRDRIPNIDHGGYALDQCGCIVENFNYPINLMFASSMPIVQGGLTEALEALSFDNGGQVGYNE